MHFRRQVVGSLFAMVVVTTVIVAIWPRGKPLSIRCVHAFASGAESTIATCQMVSASPETVYLGEHQTIRFRVGGRWREPVKVTELEKQTLLPNKAGREFVVTVPQRSVACHLVVEYTLNAPRFRALDYLTVRGWYGRFPKLCRWGVQHLPGKPGKRYTTIELTLPGQAEAPKPVHTSRHNQRPTADAGLAACFHSEAQRPGTAEVECWAE